MKCPNCKNTVAAGVQVCDECGYIFTTSGPATPDPSNGPSPQALVPCDSETCRKNNQASPARAIYCGYCTSLLPLQNGILLQGRWLIQSILGRGGMGRTYLALDQKNKETVVVKELLDEQGRKRETKEMFFDHFQNEVKVLNSLAQLRSVPSLIVPQIFEEAPRYYFVMEYIDGDDLDHLIKHSKGPLDIDTVLKYAIEVCEVLEFLHNRQPPIVHRDIKPENLKLRRKNQSIALLDFGIARDIRVGTKLTKSLGTPGYVSPEQYRGNAETRSDLYSLAATIYYLLSKKEPDDPARKLPGALRKENPKVPEEIEAIILENLNELPNERYDTARQLMEDLRQRKMTQQIKCSNIRCQTLNERRRIYCSSCAKPLSDHFKPCRVCRHPIPVKARFCPECGEDQFK